MSADVVISEVSIVVVGSHHNPTILNPDFLRYNGIVPEDWDLGDPAPVTTEMVARVGYANGVEIVSQPQRVMFREVAHGPEASVDVRGSSLPGIVRRYVQTLPHVEYGAFGINPKAFVRADSDEAARGFVAGRFIQSGPWMDLGERPPRVSLKFVYDADGAQFALSLDTAKLEQEGKETQPLVTFTGNFHYAIGGTNKDERLAVISQVLESWQAVHDRFLNSTMVLIGDAAL